MAPTAAERVLLDAPCRVGDHGGDRFVGCLFRHRVAPPRRTHLPVDTHAKPAAPLLRVRSLFPDSVRCSERLLARPPRREEEQQVGEVHGAAAVEVAGLRMACACASQVVGGVQCEELPLFTLP